MSWLVRYVHLATLTAFVYFLANQALPISIICASSPYTTAVYLTFEQRLLSYPSTCVLSSTLRGAGA